MKMRQMIEKKIKLQFVVKFKDRRQYSEPLARALITNVMARMKDILDKKSGIVQSKSDVYGQFLPVRPSTLLSSASHVTFRISPS